MPVNLRLSAALALAFALSACGGGGSSVTSAPRPPAGKGKVAAAIPPTKAPPPRTAPPKPVVLAAPGLEAVIGASGNDLIRLFGTPRLDVAEGDARKLQFLGASCVLDIYLYPEGGKEPRATYVDARRQSDGKDVDRAACVAALRKR